MGNCSARCGGNLLGTARRPARADGARHLRRVMGDAVCNAVSQPGALQSCHPASPQRATIINTPSGKARCNCGATGTVSCLHNTAASERNAVSQQAPGSLLDAPWTKPTSQRWPSMAICPLVRAYWRRA
jgi:hypothetical protein